MQEIENTKDLAALKAAVDLLESDSLTMQIAGLVGTPIEWMLEKLPKGASEKIQKAVRGALSKSVGAALLTMSGTEAEESSNKTHIGLAAISGAVGGFFGMAGTLLELPVSTTIMMRSVADIARSQGFDVNDALIKVECIQVFALGGPREDDDAADSAYYGMRNAMVAVASEVGKGLAEAAARATAGATTSAGLKASGGITPQEVGGLLVRLIEAVAGRFGVQVTEKMAAQAVPVVGAVSGATINSLFINHFQDMATGHFTVLRLEKIYGKEVVRAHYSSFASARRSRS
ncbi:peptidase [Delftia acidovorans]|uniref:Peptidase n=1 Tax=Chryseobacterium sp. B5 TaxID=2050562 RepID=A0A2G7TB03_9FLAO|nr:peptidase [Delftia acidovorans]